MAIDRIDWHWDSVTDATSDDEHWEGAGAHIGYYLEWAFRRGFANTEIHGSTDEVENIFDSGVNGVQFLIDYCDTKFCDDNLNEEGQRFTSYAYDKYVENFEKITGHKMYTKNYNQQDSETLLRLSNFPKMIVLISERVGMQTEVDLIQQTSKANPRSSSRLKCQVLPPRSLPFSVY